MDDKYLIKFLGGPTAVARILGYDTRNGGVQRVQNWMARGIPAAVKLRHGDIFLSRPEVILDPVEKKDAV